ncbi:hypothetical protein OEG84_23590 [Hoeflea sp. G2-23]|uniref:Uncharacterized protein n=1 Tax=Hoeflea algicola TaxID=2983763 RepID=A0ABT3ZH74_9HYPH|nr:hypothetical protein [Hoeflea algicola]MCY0149299.1 hypothetical protein [Hoeflea algicola]MCY0150604.1 hypothetical protein [Hoeflea algicola]
MPVSRKMQIYNSIVHYKCGNCDAEVDITPAASIGVATTVGILALGFWGWVLFRGSGSPGFIALSLYGVVGLIYFWFTLTPLMKHFRNPLLKHGEPVQTPVDPANAHIARRPILWIESLGYFAGLIAPLIFIICVLGGAALIGYINFTYF